MGLDVHIVYTIMETKGVDRSHSAFQASCLESRTPVPNPWCGGRGVPSPGIGPRTPLHFSKFKGEERGERERGKEERGGEREKEEGGERRDGK